MMFINGFLFTLGSMFAFCFFIFALAAFLKRSKKPVKATGKDWREYMNEAIKDNRFEESAMLTKLLATKKDDDKIETPSGYKVTVLKSLVIDENGTEEGVSKIKVHNTFKIKKIEN